MKKTVIIALAVMLLISVAGCKKNDAAPPQEEEEAVSVQQETEVTYIPVNDENGVSTDIVDGVFMISNKELGTLSFSIPENLHIAYFTHEGEDLVGDIFLADEADLNVLRISTRVLGKDITIGSEAVTAGKNTFYKIQNSELHIMDTGEYLVCVYTEAGVEDFEGLLASIKSEK